MNQIFEEENHVYQFDFSKAKWAIDSLHDVFSQNKVSILSDVDFIAETDNCLILVEYKNSNIPGAVNPEAFDLQSQKLQNKIAYKFYDSWIYLKARGKEKPMKYVFIVEFPNADLVMRKRLREKISNLLPFKLQSSPEIKCKIIESFDVLSISEWNTHDVYKNFPITSIR